MRKICLACLCFIAAACFAQSPPTFTTDQKLTVRDAQHKLDAVEKQQKDLGLQIQDLQTKIQTESQRLAKSYADAKAAVDKAEAEADRGRGREEVETRLGDFDLQCCACAGRAAECFQPA